MSSHNLNRTKVPQQLVWRKCFRAVADTTLGPAQKFRPTSPPSAILPQPPPRLFSWVARSSPRPARLQHLPEAARVLLRPCSPARAAIPQKLTSPIEANWEAAAATCRLPPLASRTPSIPKRYGAASASSTKLTSLPSKPTKPLPPTVPLPTMLSHWLFKQNRGGGKVHELLVTGWRPLAGGPVWQPSGIPASQVCKFARLFVWYRGSKTVPQKLDASGLQGTFDHARYPGEAPPISHNSRRRLPHWPGRVTVIVRTFRGRWRSGHTPPYFEELVLASGVLRLPTVTSWGCLPSASLCHWQRVHPVSVPSCHYLSLLLLSSSSRGNLSSFLPPSNNLTASVVVSSHLFPHSSLAFSITRCQCSLFLVHHRASSVIGIAYLAHLLSNSRYVSMPCFYPQATTDSASLELTGSR